MGDSCTAAKCWCEPVSHNFCCHSLWFRIASTFERRDRLRCTRRPQNAQTNVAANVQASQLRRCARVSTTKPTSKAVPQPQVRPLSVQRVAIRWQQTSEDLAGRTRAKEFCTQPHSSAWTVQCMCCALVAHLKLVALTHSLTHSLTWGLVFETIPGRRSCEGQPVVDGSEWTQRLRHHGCSCRNTQRAPGCGRTTA